MNNNMIYPSLWFNGNASEASKFYSTVFNNTVVREENKFVSTFESNGQKFMCLNGGPGFTINPSISFFVVFEDEGELEKTWAILLKGGSVLMPLDKYEWTEKYGWLQDKFNVSWQLSLGKLKDVGQKFTPVLMFTGEQSGKAEQAIQFYTSVFKGSSIVGIMKYGKGENEVEGTVKHAQFKLGKHVFMAMDSSLQHQFSFNEAISLVVDCETQEQIDYYWANLTKGGSEGQCGWLKDKFGVSWQIVPTILPELLSDPSRAERVTNAFLRMKKFEIEKLVNA